MAVDTEKTIRNQVLYSIYVRNYSEAGTFTAVQADLDRIKALARTSSGCCPSTRPVKSIARARSAAPTPSAITAL